MEQKEYVTKVFAALPVAIDGLKAMNNLADLEKQYYANHIPIDKFLDYRIIIDDFIKDYGQKYLECLEFFEHVGIDPYPINKKWMKENREFAKKWGIKRKPWYQRILKK